MLGFNFNMIEQLAFYGEYHNDWRCVLRPGPCLRGAIRPDER